MPLGYIFTEMFSPLIPVAIYIDALIDRLANPTNQLRENLFQTKVIRIRMHIIPASNTPVIKYVDINSTTDTKQLA